jgi:molybdate transport system ATP-binding protein
MLDININTQLGSFKLNIQTSIPTHGVSAIFGPSGSGKSSLLNIIAGFNLPDKHSMNSIYFNDQPWLLNSDATGYINRPIHQRRIAYVTQTACLFSHLTVQKNLQYAIDRSPKNSNIDYHDICTRLKIHKLLDKLPEQLSGGEQQRVAIARALLSAPQLILFDEPLSALDEINREEVLHHLEQLHHAFEIPFLYVTHNIEELMRLADHVLLLDNGKLIANRPISDILPDLNLPLSRHQNSGVIIDTAVEAFDTQYQLIKLNLGGDQFLWVSGAYINSNSNKNAAPQSRIRIRIYAKDVSIALQAATDSSILNIIPVTITDISEVKNRQAIIKLTCDNHLILSRLTVKSIQQLGLAPGQRVFAQIKGIALLGAA